MAQEPKPHGADMKRNPDRTSVPVSYRSSESRFIEPGYGPNILPGLRPDATGALFVGIDASVKHDSTALVCVKYDQHSDNLVLADHCIWQPVPGAPMDLKRRLSFTIAGSRAGRLALRKFSLSPFRCTGQSGRCKRRACRLSAAINANSIGNTTTQKPGVTLQ